MTIRTKNGCLICAYCIFKDCVSYCSHPKGIFVSSKKFENFKDAVKFINEKINERPPTPTNYVCEKFSLMHGENEDQKERQRAIEDLARSIID